MPVSVAVIDDKQQFPAIRGTAVHARPLTLSALAKNAVEDRISEQLARIREQVSLRVHDAKTSEMQPLVGTQLGHISDALGMNRQCDLPTAGTTRQAFGALIKAGADNREALLEHLRACDPIEILDVAIGDYREFGNETRLLLAASLLSSIGMRAFPALARLLSSRAAESSYFVHVVAHLAGVPVGAKRVLLDYVSRSEDPEIREAAQEAIEDLIAE